MVTLKCIHYQISYNNTLDGLINHLERQSLIILDDFGLQNPGQDVRLTLLQLLEDRYEKRSIIITSQLLVSKWYDYINDGPKDGQYLLFLSNEFGQKRFTAFR